MNTGQHSTRSHEVKEFVDVIAIILTYLVCLGPPDADLVRRKLASQSSPFTHPGKSLIIRTTAVRTKTNAPDRVGSRARWDRARPENQAST